MNQNTSFRYLVYDIETVTHKPLLNRVLYPGLSKTDEQAYQDYLETLDDDKKFVNPSFHRPISIAVLALAADFSISKIGLLGGKEKTVSQIVTDFWDIYNNNEPVLVDFNGKGFDLRVLELWAFHLGLQIHSRHFKKFGTRYKFNEENHIDLQDFLTNYNSIRFKGGLDLFSKILGKPGKMSTKGEMVQELFDQNRRFDIDNYCLSDVMDTYFVFLRTRVMMGLIDLKQEEDLVEQAYQKCLEMKEEKGYFSEYLENFQKWQIDEG